MLAQGHPSQNTPSPGTPVIAPLANLVGHRAEAGLVAVVRSHHWEGNRVHHPRSSGAGGIHYLPTATSCTSGSPEPSEQLAI